MNRQQKAIHDRLGEFGWELAGREVVNEWWADDCWRLRSTWPPATCEAFLTFIVNPQSSVYNRLPGEKVWAVKASSVLPKTWEEEGREFLLEFGHEWTDRLPQLFGSLSRIRGEHGS